MEISGKTGLAALIGYPASHSISPQMSNLSFEALGIDCIYLAFDVREEDLQAAVAGLKAVGAIGYNVTMPFKEKIIPYMDELTDAARFAGSCNTVIQKDGRAIGHTTDGEGFLRSAAENGCDLKGKKFSILGSGGAAKSIIAHAALNGVTEIDLFRRIRKPEKAGDIARAEWITAYAGTVALARQISEATGCVINVYDIADKDALQKSLSESVMLVNATNVGMEPDTDDCPITDSTLLSPPLFVYDVIYHPKETKLLRMARDAGCRAANGEGMLLYQGAASFQCWTGQEMPVDLVRRQLFSS
ncbi:MAG: shikimate dehydrogenase [Coprobacillus sp.]|nr:shikimate dehydrogenase [Coprobacillus sp.]